VSRPARIVVAHEADDLRDAALRVVRGLGLEGVGVADGESARALVLASPPPAALVVDVGLPRVLAYQLVDEVRAAGLPLGVILIASVYSRTAYKRRPASLHGADDYVEQHHLPDQLGEKLLRLLPPGTTTPAAHAAAAAAAAHPVHAGGSNGAPPGLREESERIRKAGEGRLAFRYATPEEAMARARKLAEVIVADLLLYAGAEVDRARTRTELEGLLGTDLAAGRDLLALRVPAEIAAAHDYVGAALDAYVDARAGANPSTIDREKP
jgi:CheY-like chemotaxis protein